MRVGAPSLSQIRRRGHASARRAGFAAALLLLAPSAALAAASAKASSPWGAVKCERYGSAWTQVLARIGTRGLGADFLARHAAFLASGCQGPHDVCPRSQEEFRLADDMVVLAMNAGTASTFPPFGCPAGTVPSPTVPAPVRSP